MRELNRLPIENEQVGSTVTTNAVGSAQGDVYVGHIDVGSPLYRDMSLIVKVTTGSQAPGSGKDLTCFYAFSYEEISVNALAPAQLSTMETDLVCALENNADTIRYYSTALIHPTATYLYIWYDCDSLDATGDVDFDVYIVRL